MLARELVWRRTVFDGYRMKVSALPGVRAGDDRTVETAGWYVAIEEPATGPRFWLDVASEDGSDLSRGAGSWNDLSWGRPISPSSMGVLRSLLPAGGGASTASRDSTTTIASTTVAESTSRPAVLYPTDMTCAPGRRESRHTTGSGEWVAAQTRSASAHASA
jgi:hypothetical protein